MTMLEKMAEAIAASAGDSLAAADSIDRCDGWIGDDYRAAARAALMAIREPSIPVAAAGQWDWLRNVMGFTSPTPPVRDCVEANAAATKAFTAMIDAILAGEA